MKAQKQQILQAALALNGVDKKYVISVEGDKIITRVNWMNANFFSPGAVTNEMRMFEYAVKINDNGTYSEITGSACSTATVNAGGASYRGGAFVGNQVSYNRTVGFGPNGPINISFNSEEYKAPVRSLLESYGCKKKKGSLGKILFLSIGIPFIVIVAAIVIFLCRYIGKEPIDLNGFEAAATSYGYQFIEGIPEDYMVETGYAEHKEGKYRIEFYVFSDDSYAKVALNGSKMEYALGSSGNTSSVNSPNYANLSVETGYTYTYVSRIDNTALFVTANIEYKDEIEAFIEEIDY